MLPGQIQIGRKLGMRMMDDSLIELVESGVITGGEAYDRADQKKQFDKYV
jgi:Tfp pilus assembly pilus retraction ATPase PilT